ncbi:MAG: hydrogenase 4 subunit F [Deltaproteobacteria bacterium]|nr:hydrogenase 4 subunit F [Deltaproteobacteria bacterium]
MTMLVLMLAIPAGCAILAGLARRERTVLAVCVLGSLAAAAATVAAAARAFGRPVLALGGQLLLDALSAYHALLVVGVFALSSVYACFYFAPAIASGSFDGRKARRFGVLWFLFLGSMLVTLVSNNVGLMWVGMEATTIASALLVCLDRERPAVRAAWTYLLMCSVAIALALLGIVVTCAEARGVGGDDASIFLWTTLEGLAPELRPGPVRLAFLFAVVGYGTKAGLAPMHSWLPDAHGQAPTPVSAVLSGVLLNCALYCLSRFLPIVEPSGPGWATGVLVPFGVLSMAVAAAFIVHERDVKRLLAFHSVEHMGIITLGLGFGASAAALFHTLNHSVCKMLTFFCAGALAQRYGTHDMSRMRGTLRALPIAGGGFFAGLVALIGVPPFSVFMSELWIAKVGIERGHVAAVVAFFAAAAVVFVAAFRHAVEMTWTDPSSKPPVGPSRGVGLALVAAPLAVLVVLGLWMPPALGHVLDSAASVIESARP